ncbi:hypothetical protein BJ085DRAFT_13446, partial [Dimargaris cristalligena]
MVSNRGSSATPSTCSESAPTKKGPAEDGERVTTPALGESAPSSELEDGNDEEAGDEEEQEEEEEDEDEEEDEPQLKYKRILNSTQPNDLLHRDTASCIAVGDKFVAVGTHGGVISLHDLDGNQVRSWAAHSATVNALSLDHAGEYIGSAGDDGYVSVHSLFNSERTSYRFLRPMKCVALHPNYAHEPARPFVTGGMAGDLVLSERGWLGQKRDTLLHSGEGPIFTVQWQGTFITWASDSGVRIYDTRTQRRITHIARPADSPRADLYPCHLCWQDHRTLLIGWADQVTVVVVKERAPTAAAPPNPSPGTPQLYAVIGAVFSVDSAICGIAPFRQQIMILSYDVDTLRPDEDFRSETQQRRSRADPPSLRLISSAAEELSCDLLPVRGFELYQAHDYRLGIVRDDRWFYILSPKDVLCAKPRDWRDRVDWLTERERYDTALEVIQEEEQRPTGSPPDDETVASVGQLLMEQYIDRGQFSQAAELAPQVLRTNTELWEKWVFEFAQMNRLHDIAPFIPTATPRLSSTIYEMVLAFWLTQDTKHLAGTIRQWPSELYNVPSVIVAVESKLQRQLDRDARLLMDVLETLYEYENRPDKIVEYALRLYKPDIISRISSRQWITELRSKAALLLAYDYHDYRVTHPAPDANDSEALAALSRASGIQLLVQHFDTIPPHAVVRQLQQQGQLYYLHIYLHALYLADTQGRPHTVDPTSAAAAAVYGAPGMVSAEHHTNQLSAPFHDKQVELYAEYDYPFLLRFLRYSHGYRLEHALQVCESRDLVPEMVYLLGRMGDSHEALQLILHRLRNVPQAIEFAREQNDPALWEELLTYARDQPEFVTGLLEQAGSHHVDPVRVLQAMIPGLEVPGLKGTLIRILQDLQLQVSLRRGCEKILSADCIRFSDHLRRAQRLGI